MTKNHDGKLEEVVYKPKSESGYPQELKPENEVKKDTCMFLYFASLIANLMSTSLGVMVTWTSPVSLKLLSTDPGINPLGEPITPFQLSFLGSLSTFGSIIGFLIFGKVYDIVGRKKMLITVSVIIMTCLVIIAFSTNIYFYFVSLTIIGFGLSGGMLGTTMYTSEITEDHNRAKFICFMGLGIPLGNLFDFVIGPFWSVKLFTLLCALPLLVYSICFVTILPESPVYLISTGDTAGAKKALSKLRNKSRREIDKEIEIIEFAQKQISTTSEKSGLMFLVKDRATRRGLFLSIAVWGFSILSGAPPLMTYLELIFQEASTGISSFTSTIVAGIIQMICCFGASLVVESSGRKPLLLISSLGSSIPLFLLGSFFYLKQLGSPIVGSLGWLPTASVILFLMCNIIGFGSVPMVLASEFFPNNVKSIAISFAMLFSCMIIAVVLFLFPIMMATFGLAWVFWIYGAFCVLAFIFIYCQLPETKGKSMLEIQEILRK